MSKYPTQTTKLKITADHGGKCALCGLGGKKIYTNSKEENQLDSFNIGQFAHIHSENNCGPRYDKKIPDSFLSSKENFLLLCSNHHNYIDQNVKMFPAKKLKKIRKNHVENIRKRLDLKVIERVIIILLRDDYFGGLNTSTIQNTLSESEVVVNYLDFRTQTQNSSKILWEEGFQYYIDKWNEFKTDFFEDLKSSIDCFHIYGITQIPYVFFFGLLFNDTPKLFSHQWNREENKWEGFSETDKSEIFKPSISIHDTDDIILKIELSSKINNKIIDKLGLNLKNQASLQVEDPSRTWLKSLNQTKSFLNHYRNLMDEIKEQLPKSEIHLFYAGPVPPLFQMASAYNPRMDRPINIYYYYINPDTKLSEYKFVFNSVEIMQKYNFL
ncbi:SAVED domain-containing protein [Candidatus Lokiarchaeum ossiferum]|uniref:SAVED domain-containing protein n=1 Tax=Candidatus Lokiarchaeum ossiferum TaxID=2951803 RepID=UPI00352D8A72